MHVVWWFCGVEAANHQPKNTLLPHEQILADSMHYHAEPYGRDHKLRVDHPHQQRVHRTCCSTTSTTPAVTTMLRGACGNVHYSVGTFVCRALIHEWLLHWGRHNRKRRMPNRASALVRGLSPPLRGASTPSAGCLHAVHLTECWECACTSQVCLGANSDL